MNRLNEYNKKRNFNKTQEPKGILKKEKQKNNLSHKVFNYS